YRRPRPSDEGNRADRLKIRRHSRPPINQSTRITMALEIQDYALIGDCKTAALVGRDGAIDWLCWPRFDSSACFAALLGTAENGRWLIAPVQPSISVSRRYRPGTLVLETEFETENGRATVIDFMPISDEPSLVRIVV